MNRANDRRTTTCANLGAGFRTTFDLTPRVHPGTPLGMNHRTHMGSALDIHRGESPRIRVAPIASGPVLAPAPAAASAHPWPPRPWRAWLGRLALAAVAACPWAVQAQGSIYVSSEKDHAITVLDARTQSVNGIIATCKRPRHMQLSPDRKLLMVACGDSRQADLIDLVTRKSVRRIGLGDDPEIFDVSPDGRTLYVSNEEDAELGIVDIASGKRTGAIRVGEEPEGVRMSPDGRRVYVTSEVANLVHIIDVASGKVLKNLPVGKRPRRFALTPDGSQLWVTNELDASVSIIDTQAQAVVGTVRFELKGARASDITPVGITMSRDGRRAFVALGNANHVAFVDVASRQVRSMALVGKRAWSVALDAAEKTLYVVNGLSDDLSIVDVATAKATRTVKVGRVPHTVVVVE